MLRSSFFEETTNPWSPSSTYINVGSLQNILTFAEKSGHIDRVGELIITVRISPCNVFPRFGPYLKLFKVMFKLRKKGESEIGSLGVTFGVFGSELACFANFCFENLALNVLIFFV